MVDLCYQPDTRSKHHRAKQVQPLDQTPVVRVSSTHPKARAMTREQGRKDNCKLQEFGHIGPVVGEEENDSETDQGCPKGRKNHLSPASVLDRVALSQLISQVFGDQFTPDPSVNLPEKPSMALVVHGGELTVRSSESYPVALHTFLEDD